MDNRITLCGNDCAACGQRYELRCPGCAAGPGSARGDCEIAACCRERSPGGCAGCVSRGECALYASRTQMPAYRLYRQPRQQPGPLPDGAVHLMADTLMTMFWLLIGGVVLNMISMLLTSEGGALFMGGALKIAAAASLIGGLVYVVYGVLTLRLGRLCRSYKPAGILWIIAGALNALTALLTLLPVAGISLFSSRGQGISGLAMILMVIALGKEISGHRQMLRGLRPALARSWGAVWWCSLAFMLGTLAAAAILLAGAMVLGAAAALICGLGMIVMSILRFIWLARSAGTFRDELIRRAGGGRYGR